jgi:hypothetical protein
LTVESGKPVMLIENEGSPVWHTSVKIISVSVCAQKFKDIIQELVPDQAQRIMITSDSTVEAQCLI